jgi:hypothetical protein
MDSENKVINNITYQNNINFYNNKENNIKKEEEYKVNLPTNTIYDNIFILTHI